MSFNLKNKKKILVYVRFLKLSPIKVQRILNYIRNKTYREALLCLELMPYKSCIYIWQILINAISIFQQKFNINSNLCFIQEAKVDKGPIKKQINFNARGKYSIIKKKSCHISIQVSI